MGFFGARIVGTISNGNTHLQLNRNSALGSKDTVLALPMDEVIFQSVKKYGDWEPEVSKFLAHGLK